ncbi:MAG TPA: T9SS type A sorting domain-containing protein [Flavobacteriales bacterium]|nr:T9SS type A sorting domain-containing protein [Flavobacteriales bacterium]
MRKIALILALIGSTSVIGQLLTNNGAAIALQSGAQLTVQGDVMNAGSGTMTNDGTIDISGNWTNNAANDCFGSSQGVVILNGSGQSIQGSMYTQFYHLHLEGGDVTLQQDAYAGGSAASARAGVIELNDADLFLNARYLSTSNPSPGAITRTSGMLISETAPPANYGRFSWWMGTAGPGSYVVPFGNAASGSYLPVTMNITSPSTDPLFAIMFATYPTDPFATPNNRPLPVGLPSLTSLAGTENAPNVVDRFWPITTGETNSAPTATLTFTYRDSEWNTGTNTISEAQLQAQRWDGSLWSQPPMGTVNMATNSVTTSLTNNYDNVWALVQSSTPLPVELLAFDAVPDGDQVLCTWSTATELNCDRFIVQRSGDGDTFTDIGEVTAAGNSQQMQEYAFVDPSPLHGLSYYRLRQLDLDGSGTWSPMVAVILDHDNNLIAYPNPTHDQLTIVGVPENTTHIDLHDATGRVVKQWRNTPKLLGLGDVQRGMYTLVVVQDDGGSSSLKVMLE